MKFAIKGLDLLISAALGFGFGNTVLNHSLRNLLI
jgi:hypothetical protein